MGLNCFTRTQCHPCTGTLCWPTTTVLTGLAPWPRTSVTEATCCGGHVTTCVARTESGTWMPVVMPRPLVTWSRVLTLDTCLHLPRPRVTWSRVPTLLTWIIHTWSCSMTRSRGEPSSSTRVNIRLAWQSLIVFKVGLTRRKVLKVVKGVTYSRRDE